MRIAVDLDGVCYEWSKTARYMLREYRGYAEGGPMSTESTSWNYIQDNVSKDDWHWLWTDGVDRGLFRFGHMVSGARRGLEALQEAGHKLIIASHRPSEAVNDTIDWLGLYFKGINIDGIHIFTHMEPKNTVEADILIDDKIENVEEWGKNKYVFDDRWALLFDREWNQQHTWKNEQLARKGITRVKGWGGVVEWVTSK